MPGLDDQDQSEVFDEDNTDASEAGGITSEFRTFEAQPEVLDVTSRAEDIDDARLGNEDQEIDDAPVFDAVQPETGARPADVSVEPADAGGGSEGDGEVELVYSGLLDDADGAQASGADWEARRLADDDLEDLGYGREGDNQ